MIAPKSRLANAGTAMHTAPMAPSFGSIFQKINQTHSATNPSPTTLAIQRDGFLSINHSHIHSRIRANPIGGRSGVFMYYVVVALCKSEVEFSR